MTDDDELFTPPAPTFREVESVAAPEPRPVPLTDARAAGRVVGLVLLATGTPTADEVRRANSGLARLGRPPLAPRDFVLATPEQLAPLIPEALRAPLLSIVAELAGTEPIRRRLAAACAALWGLPLPDPAPSAVNNSSTETSPGADGSALIRWLIGSLPRHQHGRTSEEDRMSQGPFRGAETHAPQLEPSVRDPLRARVERIRDEAQAVIDAVERVIIGKRDVVERVLTAMAARGHVLLVDVPGVGKTQLCKALSAAIAVRFGRVQFTPDLLPMDITGGSVFDVRARQFYFRPGPVFAHLLLADEINRATPKTQSALLEVMEERSVTVDGVTHRLEEPFQVLATMNPLDHQGTFALPAAQIDRFMVMLELGYPSPDDEVRVLDTHLAPEPALDSVSAVIAREAFLGWRETAPLIHVSPEIKRAAVDYVNGLRSSGEETQAISPRATLSWVRLSQARAMLAGREFVTMEDLLDVAPDVLRHRLWTDGASVRERLRAVSLRAAGGAR